MSTQFDPVIHARQPGPQSDGLQTIFRRLNQRMQCDQVVQDTTDDIRRCLDVDRVVLYYFYSEWEGQVTFESLGNREYSILGSTGPSQCFTDEYAALYLTNRVSSIADIETASIEPCHRDFLRYLGVRANLVVPILTIHGLWGLLVAHHCRSKKIWSETDIERMRQGASVLASASSIRGD